MAAKSSLKNMTLCLTAVCLVCSALLAGVYVLTLDAISLANGKVQEEAVAKVLPEGVEIGSCVNVDFNGNALEYYPAISGGKTVAYAVKSSAVGFGGKLVLMVGVLADGTIYSTSVLDASGETPGLGANCATDSVFISQWRGLGPEKVLSVKQDGGDVDAITASTITSRAYTKAVSIAREFVKSSGEQDNEQ